MTTNFFFNDLGKSAKDLFKKGFPVKNLVEHELNVKFASGLQFQGTATKNAKGRIVTGVTHTIPISGYPLQLVVNALQDPSKGITGKLVYQATDLAGLKIWIGANVAHSESLTKAPLPNRHVTFGAEYRHAHWATSGFFKYILEAPKSRDRQPVVGGNVAFSYNQFSAGAIIENRLAIEDENNELTKYGLTFDYRMDPTLTLTAYLLNERDEEHESAPPKQILGLSAFKRFIDFELATDVSYDLNTPGDENPVTLNVGGVFHPHIDTTLRVKFDTTAKTGVSMEQALNKNSSVTLGMELDPSSSKSAKFGVSLNFNY